MTQTQRVLIVDDRLDEVELLRSFLEEDGLVIRGLTDPTQIDDVFKEFAPDIVLLDLHMPSVDGLEVLRRLRRPRAELGFLPVLVLTGDAARVARNTALVLGADDYLTKPPDRQEVVLRVRNLLRTRRLYVELQKANVNLERELNEPS